MSCGLSLSKDMEVKPGGNVHFMGGLISRVRVFEGSEIFEVYTKKEGEITSILTLSFSDKGWAIDGYPMSPCFLNVSYSNGEKFPVIYLSIKEKNDTRKCRILRKNKLLYVISEGDLNENEIVGELEE